MAINKDNLKISHGIKQMSKRRLNEEKWAIGK